MLPKIYLHAHFLCCSEIRGGCGVSHKDIHIYAVDITSDTILEKSNNEGATIIFTLLKHVTNFKPYYGCLPSTLSLSSLSSLTLSNYCNNRPNSRAGSGSDPLNKLLLLCPPGLLCWQSPKHSSSLCPCHTYTGPALPHGLFSFLSHFPTHFRSLLSCWVTCVLFLQVCLCFLFYFLIYFIHNKGLPVIDLMF